MRSLHGRIAGGVPRWARWVAYGAALTVLPSGIWRILATVVHLPLTAHFETPPEHHGTILVTGWWYPVVLTVVSEGLAYLTVGLVATWGEVWPRRIPGLGGRPVPIAAAVIPAGLGSIVLTGLWTWTAVMLPLGRGVDGRTAGLHLGSGWQIVVFAVAYGPLIAWGPLLGIATVHYYRRRSRPQTVGDQPQRGPAQAAGHPAGRAGQRTGVEPAFRHPPAPTSPGPPTARSSGRMWAVAAIEELSEMEYGVSWARFEQLFRFRPGVSASTWPAIAEPPGSRTWSVADLPDGPGYTALDEMVNVVREGLWAATSLDGTLLALDWQHRSYRVRRGGRLSVMPDGDYIIHAAEDFSYGTFGRPWEQTLCVFGPAVVERVAARLDALLGPPRRIGGRPRPD
jgi:hypothetical protein